MRAEKWILPLALIIITMEGLVRAYSRQWAVHIDGGDQQAKQVAGDHGFQYLGEVRNFFEMFALANFFF